MTREAHKINRKGKAHSAVELFKERAEEKILTGAQPLTTEENRALLQEQFRQSREEILRLREAYAKHQREARRQEPP